MTVHMFRVCVSDAGDMTTTDLQNAIDDWIAGHTKWTDDPADTGTVAVVQADLNDPTTTYRQVNIRFDRDDTKDNILQKLTDKLKNKVAWYRVGYHVCDHDETDRSGCAWDDQAEWTDSGVTIPSYVPTFV